MTNQGITPYTAILHTQNYTMIIVLGGIKFLSIILMLIILCMCIFSRPPIAIMALLILDHGVEGKDRL